MRSTQQQPLEKILIKYPLKVVNMMMLQWLFAINGEYEVDRDKCENNFSPCLYWGGVYGAIHWVQAKGHSRIVMH